MNQFIFVMNKKISLQAHQHPIRAAFWPAGHKLSIGGLTFFKLLFDHGNHRDTTEKYFTDVCAAHTLSTGPPTKHPVSSLTEQTQ